MKSNNGKVVIITGATRGIGLEIAKKYVKSGAKVFVGARKITTDLEKLGHAAYFIKTDVRDYGQMKNFFKKTLSIAKRIDIYINNAGISIWKSIKNADEIFWNNVIDTNLKGCFFGCKLAAENLKSGGVIINIASLAGKIFEVYKFTILFGVKYKGAAIRCSFD